jgi:ABC-type antimicrobial peptide transport system permease subunit
MYYPYVLKELRQRSGRTLVNVFGIAIGLALFVSINAVSTAYKTAAGQPFKDIGADLIVQRTEKHQARAEMIGKSMRGIRLPFSNQLFRRQDLDVLKQTDGIAAHAPALLLWEFAEGGFRTLIGVDAARSYATQSFGAEPPLGAAKVRDWVKTGRFPEKPDEIALEKHFAKFHKITSGSTFLIGGKPFKVVGLIDIEEGAQVTAANIYMPLGSARMLLGRESDALNVIYLRLKKPSLLNPIKSRLARQIEGATVSSSDSFLEIMGGVSKVSEKFALIASMVGLLGALALILKTMIANLMERSPEIGILKAVGWTQQDVQRQLRSEVLLQAIVGGIIGVLAGYALSALLGLLSISIPIPWELNPAPAIARHAQAANQVVRLPVSVSLSLAATALGLAVVSGCVAAYIVGRRAAHMKPADSLRQL